MQTTTSSTTTRTRPVAEYRGAPDARERKVRQLVQVVQQREIFNVVKIVALLIAGSILSFLGPLVLASIVHELADAFDVSLPFDALALVALCCLVMIPLLFWYEHRTGGRFVEQSLDDHRDWLAGPANSYGQFAMRHDILWWIIKLEFLLFGPRMVLGGGRRFRQRKDLPHVSPHRAAEILADLLSVDEGLTLPQIKSRNESLAQLRGTLRYLELFDFVGIAKDGTRVWLLSREREKLGSIAARAAGSAA